MTKNGALAHAPTKGSTLYYSYSFLTLAQKQQIFPILAFADAIRKIPYQCTEPDVAKSKLAWWHTEIDRFESKQAIHPITQALPEINPILLHEFINGIELNYKFQSYQRPADLIQHTHRLSYIPDTLIAEILNPGQHVNTLFLHSIGVSLGLFDILDHLVEDLQRGRFYLPDEDLAKFKLNAMDFNQPHLLEQKKELFRYELNEVKKFRETALQALQSHESLFYRPWLIQSNIIMAVIKEIEKEGIQLLDHRTDLTPLRKLWVAWRTG